MPSASKSFATLPTVVPAVAIGGFAADAAIVSAADGADSANGAVASGM